MRLTAFPKTIFCLALLLGWGSCARPAAAQSETWRYVAISAPLQTVEVQTPRGSFPANFENVALVYPNGSASGFLELSEPDSAQGSNLPFKRWAVFAGRVQFRDGTVSGVLLRARAADTKIPGDEITVILRPAQAVMTIEYLVLATSPGYIKVEGTLTLIAD